MYICYIYITYEETQPSTYENPPVEKAISAREWALCQLTVCFKFQIRRERRKGQKSFALQLILRSKVQSVLLRCKKVGEYHI